LRLRCVISTRAVSSKPDVTRKAASTFHSAAALQNLADTRSPQHCPLITDHRSLFPRLRVLSNRAITHRVRHRTHHQSHARRNHRQSDATGGRRSSGILGELIASREGAKFPSITNNAAASRSAVLLHRFVAASMCHFHTGSLLKAGRHKESGVDVSLCRRTPKPGGYSQPTTLLTDY